MDNPLVAHFCAPVLIPTLCRFQHFKDCIESLKQNSLALQTDLYIALDYPFHESHHAGYAQIAEYLERLEGFKKIVILKRPENFGTKRNLEEAMALIFKKYDRCIISEDDNVFSPNFLEYMNKCLIAYSDDHSVLAINGYTHPFNVRYEQNTVFRGQTNFSAWGFGVWKDRLEEMNSIKQRSFFQHIVFTPKLLFKVYQSGAKNVRYLIGLSRKKNKKWPGDICYSLYMAAYDKYVIYPVISKVRNMGWDGSGMNCNETSREYDVYSQQIIDQDKSFELKGNDWTAFKENKSNIIKYYSQGLIINIRTAIVLLCRLTGLIR